MVFKAIAERPQLDNLTREERVREKLKFFNLETEDLDASRQRIAEKVAKKSDRFGSLKSNMVERKGATAEDGKPVMYNPFQEMIAIEAEFGSIFADDEDALLAKAREESRWYPFLEHISKKKKKKDFEKIIEDANKRKE